MNCAVCKKDIPVATLWINDRSGPATDRLLVCSEGCAIAFYDAHEQPATYRIKHEQPALSHKQSPPPEPALPEAPAKKGGK